MKEKKKKEFVAIKLEEEYYKAIITITEKQKTLPTISSVIRHCIYKELPNLQDQILKGEIQ